MWRDPLEDVVRAWFDNLVERPIAEEKDLIRDTTDKKLAFIASRADEAQMAEGAGDSGSAATEDDKEVEDELAEPAKDLSENGTTRLPKNRSMRSPWFLQFHGRELMTCGKQSPETLLAHRHRVMKLLRRGQPPMLPGSRGLDNKPLNNSKHGAPLRGDQPHQLLEWQGLPSVPHLWQPSVPGHLHPHQPPALGVNPFGISLFSATVRKNRGKCLRSFFSNY